ALSFPLDEAPRWMKEFRVIHESLDEDKLTPEFIKKEGIQAWASVPLIISDAEERWLGTLIVGSKDIYAINEDKARALKVIADQLALGIEHVRSLRDARERLARLQTLRDIDRAIIQRLDLKEVLKVVVERVPKDLGADASAISLIDEGGLKTKVFLMRVNGGRYIEEECFSMAEGLLNSFINLKEVVIIYNLEEEPRIQMHRERIRNGRFFSYLGVPLISGEKTIGILHILTRQPKVFSDEDVEFFKTLGGQAAIAIENARLFESLKEELGIRTRAEEALRETTLRLNHLLNTSPTIIYSCKVEGDRILLTWVSSNITSILGYTPEEVIKPYWWINNLHPDDRDKVIAIQEELFSKDHLEHEYRFLKKNGETIWVRDEIRLLKDSQGNPVEIVGAWMDITELKKMEEKRRSLEEQLFQSQKMEAIGRLAGGVAHDFNNILSIIKGYTQLLMLDIKEGDPKREGLNEINQAVDRAVAMTRQLLAFSRKQILEMRVLDLNSVIRNLEKMLRRMIGEDIELRTILSEDIGRIEADPGQIEQVIMNLAVNARDAMPYGGKFTIETANVDLDEEYAKRHMDVKAGKYVMLSVSDTGIGMTKEVQERIFEPFFTTKGVGKGTGLGLSTVYGIVKQSGGNIWVYSEPGKGTTFKIYLPRVEKPSEEIRAKEEAKGLPHGNETILLVEDDEKVRGVAQKILLKQGYDVIEARGGDEAIEICKGIKRPIHLVLTDVVMPGMSGRELIERIKEVCKDFKVLYMSGYTDNVILHHGILEEGIAFIQKPFTLEALVRKVREVLDKQ
ncbi:MAG: GAF domain-containing protein, partial [Thermodesulfobacteriota bacterium]